MEYLHQSTYGHMGRFHTMKPVMAIHNGHIYDVQSGKVDFAKPIYRVSQGMAYATEHHPGGVSPHATFEIRGDKVFTTPNHPLHTPDMHMFQIKPGH
jgi:hypothetical protein